MGLKKKKLTSLRRAKVLARRGSTGAGTTSLLDAERPTLDDLTLETILGGVSLVRGHHLDESEASGLLGMRVSHDLALVDLSVLLEDSRNFSFRQFGVDTSHKQVGARVDRLVVVVIVVVSLMVSLASVILLLTNCTSNQSVVPFAKTCLSRGTWRNNNGSKELTVQHDHWARPSDEAHDHRQRQGEGRRCEDRGSEVRLLRDSNISCSKEERNTRTSTYPRSDHPQGSRSPFQGCP